MFASAAPDGRASTATLELAFAALARHPDVVAELWFLRAGDRPPASPSTRVVDDLRTWPVARALEVARLRSLANHLRGARLKHWYRSLDPDAMILDDGLGSRLIPRGTRPPAIIVRPNPSGPDAPAATETRISAATADAVLHLPGCDVASVAGFPLGEFGDFSELEDLRSAGRRSTVRSALQLPRDVPIVVAWPAEGPVVSAVLSAVARSRLRGRSVVALFADPARSPANLDDLRRLAERFAIGDAVFHRPADGWATRLCGDAVVIGDVPDLAADLSRLAAAGMPAAAITHGDLGEQAVARLLDRMDHEPRPPDPRLTDPGRWADAFASFVRQRLVAPKERPARTR